MADGYVKRNDVIWVLWSASKEELRKHLQGKSEGREYPHSTLTKAVTLLNKVPTADVVEVVRCMDCKYWEHEEDVDFICTRHYGYRASTDFCSYGERRE